GMSHFSVMVKETSQLFAGGPPVVKQGLNQDVTKEELGGWKVHTKSGAVQNVAENEKDALNQTKKFLSYLPRNVFNVPSRKETQDDPNRINKELNDIIPRDRRKIFNIRKILNIVFDNDSTFEMGRYF